MKDYVKPKISINPNITCDVIMVSGDVDVGWDSDWDKDWVG